MESLVTIGLIITAILLSWRFLNFLFRPVDRLIKKLESRTCPFCKSEIPKDATVCKYCHRNIEPIKPVEMKTAQDFVNQREKRIEIIDKVLSQFRSEYPEVDFQYDTTLGDIVIKVPAEKKSSTGIKFESREEYEKWKASKTKEHEERQRPKPLLKNIRIKLIETLRSSGISAEARFLSEDRVKTVGILEKSFEDLAVERNKEDISNENKG